MWVRVGKVGCMWMARTWISGDEDAHLVAGHFDVTGRVNGSGNGLVGSEAEDGVDDGGAEKHGEGSNSGDGWCERCGRCGVLGSVDEKVWMVMGIEATGMSFLYLMGVYREVDVARPEYGNAA